MSHEHFRSLVTTLVLILSNERLEFATHDKVSRPYQELSHEPLGLELVC